MSDVHMWVKKLMPVKNGTGVLLKSPDGVPAVDFQQHNQFFRDHFAKVLAAEECPFSSHIDAHRA
eukprot:4484261-Karenia_brevis.AAC.1